MLNDKVSKRVVLLILAFSLATTCLIYFGSIVAFQNLNNLCSEEHYEGITPNSTETSNQTSYAGGNKQNKTNEAKTPRPDQITADIAQSAERYAINTNQKPSDWTHHFWCEVNAADAAIAAFTCLLFFATFILGIATIKLWEATVHLEEGAERNARRRLRAYISISAKVPTIRKGTVICEFMLENSGQTPAYKVEDRSVIWIDTYPKHSRPPALQSDDSMGAYYMGPKENMTSFQSISFNVRDLREIRLGKKAIWAIFKLTYTDTFGQKWKTTIKGHMTDDKLSDKEDRRMTLDQYDAT